MLSTIVWNVNPDLFHLGSLEVRWYGLFFAISLYLGVLLLGKIFKREHVPEKWLDQIFFYSILAIVVGARLGHVFFYEWDYYSLHPWEIIKVWHGGLASHGGTLAMFIMVYIYSKVVVKENVWWLTDRMFLPSALVAGFIRLGNLMNSEIYGHPTSLPWGIRFLRGGEQFCGTFDSYTPCTALNCCPSSEWLPCHPTQLYESLTYFLLFALMMWLYFKKDAGKYNGLLSGIGFFGIFFARQLIEIVKNDQTYFEAGMRFNMGQWLSVPFVVGGLFLMVRALKKGKQTYSVGQKQR